MDIDAIVTAGLGDTSYVLVSGDEAVLVDPQRDVGRLLAAAAARGARVRWVLETHVHNDYVSGALEARATCGAEIVGPAGAGYAFDVRPMAEGDELEVGDVRLVAVPTPGHTFEHTAYLVVERGADAPSAVFSGGSLIVGSAGRTDLLGAEHADALARAQYASVRRLAGLPDPALLLPTHGAGSFCASLAPDEDRTSTIGRERATNPVLAAADEAAFVRRQSADLLAFPVYYAHMGPANRSGPPVLGGPPVPAGLDTETVAARLEAGARLVDARDGTAFAAAHVPGSLNVPTDESFGSYVGWLVPFGAEVILLAEEAEVAEAATQLFRIGYDRIGGVLSGGVDAWHASGRPLGSYPVADVAGLLEAWRDEPGSVLDVRQRREWDEGHLPATRHAFVGDLPGRLAEIRGAPAPLTVACASGFRAAIGASLLSAQGVAVRLVARDGVPRALELAP